MRNAEMALLRNIVTRSRPSSALCVCMFKVYESHLFFVALLHTRRTSRPPHVMLRVTLSVENLTFLKTLQTNEEKIEYNGEIVIDKVTGEVQKIVHRRGQLIEPCNQGCSINWHTHPQDYRAYFPDHPSAQDAKYVLFAVARTRELVAHAVFTPRFVYFVTLSPALRLRLGNASDVEFDKVRCAIDELFKAVSLTHSDRSTPSFRSGWLGGLRDMGFVVEQFCGYDRPVTIWIQRIDPSSVRMVEADRTPSTSMQSPVPTSTSSPSVGGKLAGLALILIIAGLLSSSS